MVYFILISSCSLRSSKFSQLTFFFATGISQQEYRAAVRAGADIVWFCPPCRPSSPVGDQTSDILASEEFNPPFSSSFDQSTI